MDAVGEENKVLYAVRWRTRPSVGSNTEEAAQRALALYSKWTPPQGATYHHLLSGLDGRTGVAIVETDNPEDIAETCAKMAPYIDFRVLPVIDMAESGAEILRTAIDFRESVS